MALPCYITRARIIYDCLNPNYVKTLQQERLNIGKQQEELRIVES